MFGDAVRAFLEIKLPTAIEATKIIQILPDNYEIGQGRIRLRKVVIPKTADLILELMDREWTLSRSGLDTLFYTVLVWDAHAWFANNVIMPGFEIATLPIGGAGKKVGAKIGKKLFMKFVPKFFARAAQKVSAHNRPTKLSFKLLKY